MNQNKEFIDFLLNEYFSLKGSLLLAQYPNIEQRIREFHANKKGSPFYRLSEWLQSIVYIIQLLDANHHPRLENIQVGFNLLNLTITKIHDSYLAYFDPGFLGMPNRHFAVEDKKIGSRCLRTLCVVEKFKLHNLDIKQPRQLLTLLDLFNFCAYPDTLKSLLLYLVDLDTLSPQQSIDLQNVFSNWIIENLFDLSNGWDVNSFHLCGIVFARLIPDFINKKQAPFSLRQTSMEAFWGEQILRWVKTVQELSNQLFDSFPSFSNHITINARGIHGEELVNDKFYTPHSQKNSMQPPDPLSKQNYSVEVFASHVNSLSKVLFVIAAWPLAPIHKILSLRQKLLHNSTYPAMSINFELLLPYLLKLLQSYRLLDEYIVQSRLVVDKELRGLFNTLSHHLEAFLKYITLILIEYTHISHNSELCKFIQIYLIQEYTSTTLSHSNQYRKGLIYNIEVYFNKFQVIDSTWDSNHLVNNLVFQLIQDCSIKPKIGATFNRANVLGGSVEKNVQKRLKAMQLTNSDALRVQTTVYTISEVYLNATQLILHIIRQGWYKLSYSLQSAVVKLVTEHLGMFTKGQLELEDKYLTALLKLADALSHIPHSNQVNITIMCFELYHAFGLAGGELAEYCKHSIRRISKLIIPELLQIPLNKNM